MILKERDVFRYELVNEGNIDEFQFYNLISTIDIDILNVGKQIKLVFIPHMTKLKNMYWK